MPIYGIDILITELFNYLLSKKYQKWKKIFFCFLLSIILLTILEELGGLLIDKVFVLNFGTMMSIYLYLSFGEYSQ